MHVAIVNLTGGGFSGGYKKYLGTVVPLLREDPRVSRVTLFSPPQARELVGADADHVTWPDRDNWRSHPWLRARLRALAPDVLFLPTARHLGGTGLPTAVMVQNMEPLVVPFAGNSVADGVKNIVRRHVANRSCRSATRIIAISNYVRDFLVQRWGIAAAKVGTVYHGVEPAAAMPHMRPPAALAPVGALPIVFTAGSIRPARGLEDLLRALALLRRHSIDAVVVIAGEPNPGSEHYKTRMERLTATLGITDRVIWAGQLDATAMAWCYQHASAFVMTSRAEACPNTVLEAMSFGAPSASTNAPPMPEFFRDAALYYGGGESAELADRLRQILVELAPAARDSLRAAARRRAADFTWQSTATRTVDELLQCRMDHHA